MPLAASGPTDSSTKPAGIDRQFYGYYPQNPYIHGAETLNDRFYPQL